MSNDANMKKDPEKTADLPPYGPRNPDPLTDAPGSHPVETGIGAVLGGVGSGLAVGTLTGGPIGAVIGAIVGGGLAGGLAGKGVGELIDPTTEDNWIRDYYASEHGKSGTTTGTSASSSSASSATTHETYRPAYRYGLQAATQHEGKKFEEVETHLKSDYEKTHASTSGLDWEKARGAVRHAFDQTIQLREQRLHADKQRVKTGDVTVRKEVITEQKHITVPVEREEVVIERRAVQGHGVAGDIKAETLRIPVSEEQVTVTKDTVVKEEVSIGKRKVTEDKTVTGSVQHEEIRVEETGDVKVKGNVHKTDDKR